MSDRSQKALKIAVAVALAIAAVVFVILYLTGQVDDFLGVTGTSETSSVADSQSTQANVSTQSTTENAPKSTTESSVSTPESTPTVEKTAYKFRNQNLLDQHYEKHGREMGFSSAEEYEKAASAVVNDPNALHKTEKEDGDDVYYIERTNEFVVVSTDGYIRTYFLPDRGIDYYNKQ